MSDLKGVYPSTVEHIFSWIVFDPENEGYECSIAEELAKFIVDDAADFYLDSSYSGLVEVLVIAETPVRGVGFNAFCEYLRQMAKSKHLKFEGIGENGALFSKPPSYCFRQG